MLGIIGILAAAKRLIGVFLKIKNNGPSAKTSIGTFDGSENSITPNEWNHVAMAVSNGVASFYVNGQNAGGNLGTIPPVTNYGLAKLQNVNYLRNTSVNINANSYLGANNKTFIDKSPLNSTILTTSGALVASGVTLGSFSPYSNQEWSGQFTSTNYLSVDAVGDQFYFGREDYTVEFWAYVTQTGVEQPLLDLRYQTTNFNNIYIYISTGNKLSLNLANADRIISSSNFPLNKWCHIALVRKWDRNIILFLDGQKAGESTLQYSNLVHVATPNLVLGRQNLNSSSFNGYISNVRIIRGSAIYNSNFTPSSQPLKLIPQKENKSWSGYFPPTTNGNLSSINNNIELGLNDYTIEFWIYYNELRYTTGNYYVFDFSGGDVQKGGKFYLYHVNKQLYFNLGSTAFLISNTDQSLDTWHHIRITRKDHICKLFINGVLENFSSIGSETFNYHIKSGDAAFGAAWNNTVPFNGYITNFRIIKGLALDQASFLPETQTLSLVGASATHYTGFFGTNASCISSTIPNLGLNNFTIECWVNLRDNPGLKGTDYATVWDMRTPGTGSTANTPILYIKASTHIGAGDLIYKTSVENIVSNGISSRISNGRLLSGEWYHIAMSRDTSIGSTFYVDGYKVGFIDDRTTNYSAAGIFIGGASNGVVNGGFGGHISNFRVVTGAALYAGDFFERPKQNLSPVPGTALLTLQNKTLIDNSPYNRSLMQRNFVIAPHNLFDQTTNNYSLNFIRGYTGYLSSRDLDPGILNFRDKDYTIEFFIKTKSQVGSITQWVLDSRNFVNNGILVGLDGGNRVLLNYNNADIAKCTETLASNKWHHIAIVRKYNDSFKIYVNGIDKAVEDTGYWYGKFTFIGPITENVLGGRNLSIGVDKTAGTGLFNGDISNLRIVNGKALYNGNFTPPTQKLSIIPQEGDDVYSVNLSNGFLSVTNLTNNALNFGTNNYTVEFWIYFNELGNEVPIIDARPATTASASLYFSKNASNQWRFYYKNTEAINAGSVVANRWYHVALVRRFGIDHKLYIDGALINTYTTNPSDSYALTTNLFIGGSITTGASNTGRFYISNLRIVNGDALYTTTFSAPTADLELVDNTKLLMFQGNQANQLIDASNNFTGSNALVQRNIVSISPSKPYGYPAVKTTMLALQDKMIFKDNSSINSSLTSYNAVYGSNDNPFNNGEKTLLLTLNKATSGDESGHLTLSAFGTFAMSAVGPLGTSGYSGVFNGTTYLSAINYAPNFLDDDDFTIEFWFYKTKSGFGSLFSTKNPQSDASVDDIRFGIDADNTLFYIGRIGTTASKLKTISLYKWYHIAIIRTNRNITINLDGEPLYKDDGVGYRYDTYTLLNSRNIIIGAKFNAASIDGYYTGLISNLRIVKGKNIYQLLDKKHYNLPTEPTNNKIIEILPFSYSHYFDSTGTAGVTASKTAELEFGLNSFTIEFWVLPAAISTNQRYVHLYSGADELTITRNTDNTLSVFMKGVERAVGGSALIVESHKWNHIALVREKGIDTRLYVNGQLSNTFSGTTNLLLSGGNLSIGCRQAAAGNNTNGLISNFRVTKNAALYSGSSFSVPISPLTYYSSFELDKYSTVFNSSNNSFVSIPTLNSPNFTFGTNSFCVEFLMYAFDENKAVTIFDTRDLSNLNGNFLMIERSATNKIVCSVAGTARITSTTNISAGSWYHIVYERRANVDSRLYINGINTGTAYADSAISYSKINYVYVGGVSSSNLYSGCISNLRISNAAIYNGTVAVPATELPPLNNTQLLAFKGNSLVDYSNNQLSLCAFGVSSSNKFSAFYPSNSARTVLLTLQNNTLIDNAGIFYPDNTLKSSNVIITETNPFNKPQKSVMELFYDKEDYKKYNLSAKHDFGYSIKDPYNNDKKDFVTSFLALNEGRYKDYSIYNASLYDTNVMQRAVFTNFSPFLNLTPYSSANGGSIYFGNTSSKFLLVSSKGLVTKFDSSDFTIEFWLYKNSTAASQMMIFDTMSSVSASSPGHMQIYLDSTNKVVFYAGGAARITSSLGIPSYSWQHIAVTRRGQVTNLYINGVADKNIYDELNPGALSSGYTDPGYFALGSRLSAISSTNINTFEGYITDFHIVSGSCLYISNFSPPIQPLSSFANTKFLINADNAGVVDSTGKFNLFTGGSGVSISNDVPAITASASTGTLSAGSMYFDGSNNSFIFTDLNSPYFNLGSAYTAELWVKPTVTPSTSAVLFAVRNTDADKIVLAIDNLRRVVYRVNDIAATTNSITATAPLTANQWNHIALVRNLSSGSNFKTTLYVNAVSSGFVTTAITNSSKVLHIGSDDNRNRFTGFIDDFRIIKEVKDAYSATVDLPLREGEIHNYLAYPDDPFLSDTSLLIKDDPSINLDNNVYIDESNNKLTVNRRGAIQGSVTPFSPGFGYNPKDHGGSIYLDGSSDVYINDFNKLEAKPFNFTDNYTIEAWIKPLNAGETPPIFDTRKKAVSAVIGSAFDNSESKFKGYITGVKTSKGISRYSSNFSIDMIPPVSDQYTTLLLNFRKAGIIDVLSKNNISTVGTAAISLEQRKYGNGSISFDGGGYLAIPSADHFLVESGNFTIEWNMYVTNISNNYGIFTTCDPSTSANGHLYILFKNNALCVGTYGGSDEITFPTCSGTLDEWQHIAVARNSGNCLVFLNGILQDTKAFSTNVSLQSGAFIGKTFNAAMSGYIDEFRFTKGVCRYTSNYPNGSLSLLYDAAGTQYTTDTSTIILDPPRYPASNVLNEYLSANNTIIVDYALVGGGGAGGSSHIIGTATAGGGGGGGGFKSGTFNASKQRIIINVGAGGVATNNAASTNGNSSSIAGYLNDEAKGGGSGGSYYSSSSYFFAGSGACGGGSFGFITNMIQNSGGDGIYSKGAGSNDADVAGCGGGMGSDGVNNKLLPWKIIDANNIGGVSTDSQHPSLLIPGNNGGGRGITWDLASNKIYLSSFCGGGQGGIPYGGTRITAQAAANYYILIKCNIWGGGGILGSKNTAAANPPYKIGWFNGITNTGGGGGGSYPGNNSSFTSLYYYSQGGNGGSGCAIFRVPAVLNDFFQTTGTVERITVDSYTFIIFKSSGTLQLV